MVAAGYPGEPSSQWSQQKVIEAIRRRSQEGKSLRLKDVAQEDLALVGASRRYLGSWARARAAAEEGWT